MNAWQTRINFILPFHFIIQSIQHSCFLPFFVVLCALFVLILLLLKSFGLINKWRKKWVTQILQPHQNKKTAMANEKLYHSYISLRSLKFAMLLIFQVSNAIFSLCWQMSWTLAAFGCKLSHCRVWLGTAQLESYISFPLMLVLLLSLRLQKGICHRMYLKVLNACFFSYFAFI